MNLSYFRIRLEKEKAIERLTEWLEKPCKEKYETNLENCVDVCLNEVQEWKGICLYVYENEGFTVFEDISGFLSDCPAEAWQKFAKEEEFVFVGYNDAIPYGEFVSIKSGVVLKEFSDYEGKIEKNNGTEFPEMVSWVEVSSFVDGDEIAYSEAGEVLIF